MQALTFFFAFVAVLALIGVAAWLVRRFAGNRLGANTNRGRMPRLAVIDAAAVDGRRRLVLVRRDNIEHLLMIGGPTDIVVEPNIVRAMPGRDQMPPRPPAPSRSPVSRRCPIPATGPTATARGPTVRSRRAANARAAAAARSGPLSPTKCAARRRRCRNGAAIRWPASRRSRLVRLHRPEPLGGRPEPAPRTARRTDAVARDLAQRTDDAARRRRGRAKPPKSARPASKRGAGTAAVAPRTRPPPPPPPAAAIERRPESRRDGATAGSSPAPAGAATRSAPAGGARTAARPRTSQRAAAGSAGARRRAALRISKTRWRPCWAVQRPLREIGDSPA